MRARTGLLGLDNLDRTTILNTGMPDIPTSNQFSTGVKNTDDAGTSPAPSGDEPV